MLPAIRCSALLIFTEDCTGRPQKKAGDESITSKASVEELERIRRSHPEQVRWRATDLIAGSRREILVLRYLPSNALLVLVDPAFGEAPVNHANSRDLLDYLWDLTAARIREKVADAPPSYLRESRAVSAERTRVTTELVDQFSASLDALLATLRSGQIADAPARQKATEWAANTLVGLRTLDDRTNGLVEEPVGTAFSRLRDDLRPPERGRGGGIAVHRAARRWAGFAGRGCPRGALDHPRAGHGHDGASRRSRGFARNGIATGKTC
ncbi:hypothetical protein AAHB37_16160 [Glutamicibacter halophytocola]|uniref:hypothetical protein n=1 Tax=Glutamicibacter halophytocola TaxID=1933880 RepID=UPI00321962D4